MLLGNVLQSSKIFKDIKPFVFLTAIGEHSGIQFYEKIGFNSGILNLVKKFLGSTFLGKSCRELFSINFGNNGRILVRISQNEYLYLLP